MTYDTGLADRIRSALARQPTVREVAMFGGLSFMVNDAMVVCVGPDHLLVRVDPESHETHLLVEGARSAEMGAGRPMGRGWVAVDAGALADDADLGHWIDAALDLNARKAR